MNYKLVKRLKDAGFPYSGTDEYYNLYSYLDFNGEILKVPFLSEIIDSCGPMAENGFSDLKVGYYGKDGELAYAAFGGSGIYDNKSVGKTPEIAVAKLWLKLNKKTDS